MYEPTNYDHLLGLEGFSDEALKTHFKLYNGYVINTNKVGNLLKDMHKDGEGNTSEYAELKRRYGWEFNGMRLHEYHFEALTKEKKELSKDSELYRKIEEQYGSFKNWKDDFISTASMRGIGWTILYYDTTKDKFFNTWVNEHDAGHLAGCILLLNLDVFEHAFVIDYNVDKKSYIESFMEAIDWDEVEKRFK